MIRRREFITLLGGAGGMACSTEVRFPDLALFCRTKRAEQPASLECPRNCMTSFLSR